MPYTRTELSKKNPYYIPKFRYCELKYFCLQYPTWKAAYNSLDSLSKRPCDLELYFSYHSDPTAKCAESREYFKSRMELIEKVAKNTDPVIGNYILMAVTEGLTYDKLRARIDIPCCRVEYYKLYRKFFWILSKSQNSHLLL